MTIEELPRYERLPGEYFVLEHDSGAEQFIAKLKSLGFKAQESESWAGSVWVFAAGRDDPLGRNLRIDPTDVLTIMPSRKCYMGFSVLAYEKADFESRYRRIAQ